MTAAVLPLLCSLPLVGQETFPRNPAPPPPGVAKPALPARPEAERQFEKSRDAFQPAQPKAWAQLAPPNAGGGGAMVGGMGYASGSARFQDRLQRIVGRASGPASHPMIIRSAPMDPKDQANLEEDLAVMAHILGKTVDEAPGNRFPTAMGIDVFGEQGPAGMRSLYLEGYGALFTMNVGFPLVAAPASPEQKKEESAADSTWEEARQELYGQPPGAMVAGSLGEEFSPEKVARITDALVESLKNATNIRGLKADDSVTICLLGGAPLPVARPKHKTAGTAQPGALLAGPGGPQNGTVMTIRARKADADALAKGTLTVDEFRKQARIEKYEGGVAAGSASGFGVGGVGGMGGGMGGGYGTRF